MPDDAMSMTAWAIDSKCGGEPDVLTDEEKAERVAALEELSHCDEALIANTMERMGRAMQYETSTTVEFTNKGARN